MQDLLTPDFFDRPRRHEAPARSPARWQPRSPQGRDAVIWAARLVSATTPTRRAECYRNMVAALCSLGLRQMS